MYIVVLAISPPGPAHQKSANIYINMFSISNAFPLRSYPRHLISRHNADDTIRWCIRNNPTYLELTFRRVISGTAVLTLCHVAQQVLAHRLHEFGDGPVAAGVVNFSGADGLLLRMTTAAESTLTWQQVNTALITLYDYMVTHHFGTVTFKIFSGSTLVGEGSIGEANV